MNNTHTQRELKFRVWDFDKEEMIYPNSAKIILISNKGVVIDSETYAIMQFTGLKDKHGKEIYEADVVRSTTEFNGYTGMDSSLYGGNVYEVRNDSWRFYLYPTSMHSVNLKNLEVIGNIYENPELIEKE